MVSTTIKISLLLKFTHTSFPSGQEQRVNTFTLVKAAGGIRDKDLFSFFKKKYLNFKKKMLDNDRD